MAEYIGRQDAIRTIRAYFENLPWNGLATTVADDCEKLLNGIPAADVAEVVRCRDCVYYANNQYGGYCENIGAGMDESGYCSDAERRIACENNEELEKS